MGSRGPLPVAWSSETARGRNTFFAIQDATEPDAAVEPPVWLVADALAVWDEQAPALIASARLRSTSAATFGVYCQLVVDCDRLSRDVAEEGTVVESSRGVKANPKIRLLRDARRDLLSYAKAFALDPASAARMPSATPTAAPENPLVAYIKSRPS